MPANFYNDPATTTINGPLVVAADARTGAAATITAASLTLTNALVAGPGNFSLGASAVNTTGGAAMSVATANPISRNAPSTAGTNAVMVPGTVNGQICIVTNENVASTTLIITFNTTIATSFVANDGTNPQVVKCGTAKMFVWLASLNAAAGAWVALEPYAG
jgi:hypothetical protein